MKLKFTPRAKADLGEIFAYVAQDNFRAAARIIAKIRNNLAALIVNPYLGRPGRVDGTRELIVAQLPYIAAYRVYENEIQILAIIHAARLWPNTL